MVEVLEAAEAYGAQGVKDRLAGQAAYGMRSPRRAARSNAAIISLPAGWQVGGIGVANGLEVDAEGLLAAGVSSDDIAAALTAVDVPENASALSSSAGIAALNEALAATRTRQSQRIASQAADMSVSSARYDGADAASAAAVQVTM